MPDSGKGFRPEDYQLLGEIIGRLDGIKVQVAQLQGEVSSSLSDLSNHGARIEDLEGRMKKRSEWEEKRAAWESELWGKFLLRASGVVTLAAAITTGIVWLVKIIPR